MSDNPDSPEFAEQTRQGTRDPKDRVFLFDTTLRDGEQSPGISLSGAEKLEIAQQLARLGVDIIEAGFPIASPGDFDAVQTIAREVHGPVVCGLARAVPADIERCWEAIKDSERPRIHTFCSTSDIHIEHQMQNTREDVLGLTRASVAQARELCEDVEFSPMDATRSEVEFTAQVLQVALDEGASTINIPDTVGYAVPEEYAAFLTRLYELVPDLRNATLSTHCHNDLGLAVANSLAGAEAGARQIECAINGIGERAGNASTEEIIMALQVRGRRLGGLWTGASSQEISRTSRLVSRLTGYPVQPNKAIVGANAFAHESGIHQDGVLKNRETFEIMDARSVGLAHNQLVLGKHSGRAALRAALEELGYELDGQALNQAFTRFKELADRKKDVSALDLEALVTDELRETAGGSYHFVSYALNVVDGRPPHATVQVREPNEDVVEGSFSGDGPIDAVFRAINSATGVDVRLREFRVGAVTGGQDALGEVTVVVELGADGAPIRSDLPGTESGDRVTGAGQGVATDIIKAAAIAYVRALGNAAARAGASIDAEASATAKP
ncbi:MAG TPA: 2-isopropylmalate synthase [Baekduia sp.]|nr:2-isopropylmalate synthase [Baekduia sp.]